MKYFMKTLERCFNWTHYALSMTLSPPKLETVKFESSGGNAYECTYMKQVDVKCARQADK